ncbi:MAG TPA: GreA/GreB family elongation factor [Candidatus Eisenbacteria bacterium]|nr:GreA/GreB family elongation factor [Candidatus Eisenbacteria bacterium]
MPVRDTLPAVLRGELGAELSPEVRAQLEALAHAAQAEKKLAWMRDELGGRLKQADAAAGVYYLLAAACALNGEIERAQQTLLTLGDRLAARKLWEPLAAVAERSLGLVQTQAAARLLVQAHEGLGRDPERLDALSRAWVIVPDDLELALLLARRLGEAGRNDDRRALLAELAPRFAAEARYGGLEEAALEFAEHDDWEGLVHVARALPAVASQGAFREARSLADIAVQGLAKTERAGEALEPLRRVIAAAAAAGGDAAAAPFREAVTEALRQGPGRTVPDVAAAIAQSGLAGVEVPLPRAIEAFDAVAALAPGRGVLHDGFGPGRIVSNDTETVVLDFMKVKGQRMPYAAARRTLTPVADDDVRLLRFTNPAEMKRLREQDHGTLVVQALRALGGSGADANKLKLFLIAHDLVPAREWTAFWRKAKVACEKDPRIDHARAFEQFYRLAPEASTRAAGAEPSAPLPALEVRKPARTNLATLRRFLAQHPNLEDALRGRFGRFVERLMLDDDADRGDRARAGLYFARWFPDRRERWRGALRELWPLGLAISDLSSEEEQLTLLADSREAGVEAEAILSALDSRFAAVRDAAEAARGGLGDAGRMQLRRALVDHAVRYPAALLRLIEDELGAEPPPADAWRLFVAALQLIEEKPKPSTAEKVLRWLEAGGAFQTLLARVPMTQEMRLKIRVLLRQWRSSDRLLFPALDAVARVGLADERQWVLDHRQKRTERLFSQVGEQAEAGGAPVMTRATWLRLQQEVEQLERELRTTIPQTIQRARELGDLKENAEYHSAKLKQTNVQKQVASLQQRLGRARFVEDAEFRDGVIGLGTEVVLASGEERVSYWILGDGEQHLGANVISHQAPIGRALVGHGVGEELELGEGDARRRWRVLSVERKLPPANERTSSAR